MKTFAVRLFMKAEDLNGDTVDRISEIGFDDDMVVRSGCRIHIFVDREGESWLDVALKATKQLQDAGFEVTGVEWDEE